MLLPEGISNASSSWRSVSCSPVRTATTDWSWRGILGRGLRLGRSDGDREPVLRAAQRVALEGQVGGHHLCQAGDRSRLLVRARRRPAVADHQRRLSAPRPPDRRQVAALLPLSMRPLALSGWRAAANAVAARSRARQPKPTASTVDRVRRAAVRAGPCRSRLQSRQLGVASTYAVFDMPTICAGFSIGACAC